MLQLDCANARVIVKQSLGKSIESSVKIIDIERVCLPTKTRDILREKKCDDLPYGQQCATTVKQSKIDRNSSLYRSKCLEASFFPFWVELANKPKIELIATNLAALKVWTNGLNYLLT